MNEAPVVAEETNLSAVFIGTTTVKCPEIISEILVFFTVKIYNESLQ
jgi:hypothetical protein